MTRGLHKDTKVQRGEGGDVSPQARALGYEPSDAPPAKVALGVAAFVALILVGLAAAGLLVNAWSREHAPSTGAVARAEREPPPPPRLLVDPVRERRRIESAARARLVRGPVQIDRAMAEVVREGWDAEVPPPSTEQVARDHAEPAR